MARIKNVAAMLTAAEAARQWALNNPDKARSYIDKATGFVDQRTKGKYHSQIDGLSNAAKKGLTGRQDVSSTAEPTTEAPPAPKSSGRTFPDLRA